MTTEILMPALSPTMTEGNLIKWHVKVGDKVKAGDLLAEIETDKATMEIESVDQGTISEIIVKEGSENVSVNSVIAIINDDNNDHIKKNKKSVSENKPKENKVQNVKNLNEENFKAEIIPTNNTSDSYNLNHTKASPYVKKTAREKKLDLNSIKGTGPDGRIIKKDINLLIKDSLNNSFSSYEVIEPSKIRKIIAEKTVKTKTSVPHFYLTIESEVDSLLSLRKKINVSNFKVSINDLLVKSLGIAQSKNPETNVIWNEGKILKHSSFDVAIAVALKEGLITPVIREVDKKGIIDISNEIKNLIQKAQNNKLTPEDCNGGTISISNLGMYGIMEFKAIINSPQSSILAVGSIKKYPKIKNGNLTEVSVLKSTLSADHRVLDGAVAAKLLKDFSDIIENPFELWLQSKDMEII